ncbi:acyl-CoA Delta-9 desaturase-like [Ostrinia nubilalis]|uniref:acyl-CoA Delta-9 desaturase-like n=1 Tax=Ostrinia nubilalis TaxID=29057 RepID=UPI00308222F9
MTNEVFENFNSQLINEKAESTEIVEKFIGTNLNYKHKINWSITRRLVIIHILALWGLLKILKGEVYSATIYWIFSIAHLSYIGSSIGVHRYYSHRSFKATPLLEIILIVFQTITGQDTVFRWATDHRLHHRYADTDADPHNVKRGFFFCYFGWLCVKRNKYVMELGRKVNTSDLMANKFVMFQKRYYLPLLLLVNASIAWVPVRYFDESWWNSVLVASFFRYAFQIHFTGLVVALSHSIGTRPYNKNLQAIDSWPLTILSWGDGGHNFHHVFPWDYKSAEGHNAISLVIWTFEKLGLASDLKTVPKETVKNIIKMVGDGTHPSFGTEEGKSLVTAVGPVHPLNPTYRNIKDPEIIVRVVGSKTIFGEDLVREERSVG